MRSQAKIKTFNNTSETMLDDYYVGNGREEPEISISSSTSAEKKSPYIDCFFERVHPKQEKAKQVGSSPWPGGTPRGSRTRRSV